MKSHTQIWNSVKRGGWEKRTLKQLMEETGCTKPELRGHLTGLNLPDSWKLYPFDTSIAIAANARSRARNRRHRGIAEAMLSMAERKREARIVTMNQLRAERAKSQKARAA